MINNINTQWGGLATSFDQITLEQKQELLLELKCLINDIKEQTAITCFVSYGALLGACRNGELIGHDFDLDVVFLSDTPGLQVWESAESIINYLVKVRGYSVEAESNGQFRVKDKLGLFNLEFFAGWFCEGRYFQYFAIQGQVGEQDIIPLSTIEINNISFPGPRHPEVVLEALYGKEWKVPNPDFKYTLTADDWKPFEFLFTNKNKKFWDEYYRTRGATGVWLEEPSDFAKFIESNYSFEKFLELGSGNGRDGLFFSKTSLHAHLTDYSTSSIEFCTERAAENGLSCKVTKLNVGDLTDVSRFSLMNKDYDLVYTRFFLHAIDEHAEKNVISLAHSVLRQGGIFACEFRAAPPEDKFIKYENGEHYRRLVDVGALKRSVIASGFSLDYEEVGYGMAVYRAEDPHIGRLVFVKC